MELKINSSNFISLVLSMFSILTTNYLTKSFFSGFINFPVEEKIHALFWYVVCVSLVSTIFIAIWKIAYKFKAQLPYKRNWITACNHAWDENLDPRCIFDGAYVHIEKRDDENFYSECMKCNHIKMLQNDDGKSLSPAIIKAIIRSNDQSKFEIKIIKQPNLF